ncbi:MAG: SDR family oxidoreductase [Thermoanaerobaculia bacterium]
MSTRKIIVVTGASSGLGKLTAETLAAAGSQVYATMRNSRGSNRSTREAMLDAATTGGRKLSVVDMDVTNQKSVDQAIETILAEAGHIDVVVNNAGVMNVGVTEAYTLEAVQRQLDVDFYGPVRVNRAVLPRMRERGSGLLIQVSSLAGRVVLPFFGVYCASKFAVEALAESYRYELSSFGVDSVIVEPGPFWTQLIDRSPGADDLDRLRSYGNVASIPTSMLKSFAEFLTSEEAPDPQLVATAIQDLINRKDPRPLRTVVGVDYGVGTLNRAVEPVQRALLEGLGFGALPADNRKETSQ